jgi:hypothetical protein
MPSRAHLAGSLAAALAVGLLFLLWVGWPGFLAVSAGAVFGIAFLIVSEALGDDPRAADAAWREQSLDLRGEAASVPLGPADVGGHETATDGSRR